MEAIRLPATASTPLVILDSETNEFSITGRSLPGNPKEYYVQIFDWFDEYLKNPNNVTKLVFEIEYMNTASLKMILELMRKLKDYISTGVNINIHWIYEKYDEEVFKAGRDFADMVGIPILLICKE